MERCRGDQRGGGPPSAGAAEATQAATNGSRRWKRRCSASGRSASVSARCRPQRQLLRAGRRLAGRDQRRDDRLQRRTGPHTRRTSTRTRPLPRWPRRLIARYAAGGLARQSPGDVAHPPVPPNISYFLEHGVREHGQWRVPLILQLRPDVQVDDIRAVLTAVPNHHEALRLRIVERAGTWEQVSASRRTSPTWPPARCPTTSRREARRSAKRCCRHLKEQSANRIRRAPADRHLCPRGAGRSRATSRSVCAAIVADNASRDILLTDIFTAFGQQLAGEEIALQPVTTPWTEWSQRCAALAIHPAVVESRDFWLKTATAATLRVASRKIAGAAGRCRSGRDCVVADRRGNNRDRRRPPTAAGADRRNAVGRVGPDDRGQVGDGTVAVDLSGQGRSVLKPDVDLRRTVGWFTTVYPIALTCAKDDGGQAAARRRAQHADRRPALRNRLRAAALPVCADSAAARRRPSRRHLLLLHRHDPRPAALVRRALRSNSTPTPSLPVREAIPGLGHAIEFRVFRTAGVLHLDWWYDAAGSTGPPCSRLPAGSPGHCWS